MANQPQPPDPTQPHGVQPAVTQPHLPSVPSQPQPQPRPQQSAPQPPPRPRTKRPSILKRGCRRRTVLILIVVFLLPMFLCGNGLLLYVLFPPPPTDVLVLGLDAREGEGFATRTDSIMLLGVNPRRMRVSLLSVPRDLFISVPGYGEQRINTVNVLGELERAGYGPELLSNAVEGSFGVGVDRYARVDFNGFVDLVDAVGGVRINVPRVIEDYAYPTPDGGTMQIRFEPGWQMMDGERTLIYARTRHGDDDYKRAERQQQVITALGRRMLNPVRWLPAVAVLSRSVDTNLSLIDMALLAPPVVLSGGQFEQLVIDRDYITRTVNGNATPDFAQLAFWLEENFD